MSDQIRVDLPKGWSGPNGATSVIVPAGTTPEQLQEAFGPKQSWGTTLSEIPARAFGSFADMFGNAPTEVANLEKAGYGLATGKPQTMTPNPDYVTNMLQRTGAWKGIGGPLLLSKKPMTPAEHTVSTYGQAALQGALGGGSNLGVLKGAAAGIAGQGAAQAAHAAFPNSAAAPVLAGALASQFGGHEPANEGAWKAPTVEDLRSMGLSEGQVKLAQAGHAAGLKLTPAYTRESRIADAAQSFGGKTALERDLSLHNATAINKIAREDLGIPPNVQITVPLLNSMRAEAGKAYDAVASLPQPFKTTPQYRQRIGKIASDMVKTASEYPNVLNMKQVEAIKADLQKPEIQPRDAINLIKVLRQGAQSDLHTGANGPPPPPKIATGMAQREAADAIENLVESNLKKTPGGQILYKDFTAARQKIAKIHDYMDALNDATGDVNARHLAALDSRNPGRMTGGSKFLAQYAKSFPRVVQDPARLAGSPALSYLDTLGGLAGAAEIAGVPASGLVGRMAGMLVGRPIVRKLLTTGPAQRAIVPKGTQ